MDLKEHYASIKDTKHFDRRLNEGKKTALDFASQYVYYYGPKAEQRFVEECSDLETAFFYDVVVLIKAHQKIQETSNQVGDKELEGTELETLEIIKAALASVIKESSTENN